MPTLDDHIESIMQGAYAGSPTDIESSFGSAMQDKIMADIDVKRAEVGANVNSFDKHTVED